MFYTIQRRRLEALCFSLEISPVLVDTIWWLYFWMRWKVDEEITILADDWDDM
jgi:hypothetical protein